MHVYKVGEPYSPNKKHWPAEIEVIRKAPAHFALCVQGDIIFLLAKFGDEEWQDCGFSIHLVPETERMLPPESPEGKPLVTVLLIDAETGILKVFRALTWSEKFTANLHRAIREQASRPFPGNYNDQIDAVYRRYSSRDLANKHAIARCRGGE